MLRYRFDFIISALCVCMVFAFTAQNASGDVVRQVGTQSGEPVRQSRTIPNDTGQDANDLHIEAYQTESGVWVNGARISNADFADGTIGLSAGDILDDGRNHQADGDLTDGLVKAGNNTTINITLWLNKMNQMWLYYEWTNNGNIIGEGGRDGADIRPARPGGGGGDPAQQGGGGGSGYWLHPITIYNDNDKDMTLSYLYAYASMIYYDNMADIEWSTVPFLLEDPVVIHPGESWNTNFETEGSYLGGHVYLNYELIDGWMQIVFDHPVEAVPEPATMLLLGLGLTGVAGLRKRIARG